MNWLEKINIKIEQSADRATLVGSSKFEDLPFDLQKDIQTLYDSTCMKRRVLASILSAVFGESKGCFIFSLRSLEKLLKKDSRIKRKKLSGSTYKEIWSFLTGGVPSNAIFRVLRSDRESGFQAKKKEKGFLVYRGSILSLSQPELKSRFFKHVGSQVLSLQEEANINLFDSFFNENSTSPTKSHIMEESHEVDVDNKDENDVDFRKTEKHLNSDSFKTSLKPNTDKQGADPSQGVAKGVLAPQVSSKANTGAVSESWGVLASDDIATANAMGSSHQSVMLQRIKSLSDSGEIDLTAWEVRFVSECIESINKFNKILTTKRSEKVLEIWGKVKDAFDYNQICEAETRLIRFCREHSGLDETAIMLKYIQGFGRSEFDLATRNNDLGTLFAVAKCQRN